MSSEPRGGRARSVEGAAKAAAGAGRQALELVAGDTQETYLANLERQLAIERLLIRFGEALKDIPNATLTEIEPHVRWAGPKGFRDLASHWYEDGLDHELIWRAVTEQLPALVSALDAWISQPR
ncbi:DUF86 domain-containing protein [Phenylobacterium aquaticum]|uniref:HepT-like ribonuclease domain-containing protein n=1 Tax=Phenylobacterium aquaticum TaxID=1763816 RepID=UPI001F5C9745|nr:DUF86 domain-containing protein [Phenylobacterium aquaticum]